VLTIVSTRIFRHSLRVHTHKHEELPSLVDFRSIGADDGHGLGPM